MKYKDILKEFEYLIPKDIDLIFSGTKRPLCSRQAIVHILEKALDSNTKRVKKEILESVNERIAKVVQKRIKVDKDGIGSWKINPDDIYFADNLKNDLKNITFFVEEELK